MSAAGSALHVPNYEGTIDFHTDRTFQMKRFDVKQGCQYVTEFMIIVKRSRVCLSSRSLKGRLARFYYCFS